MTVTDNNDDIYHQAMIEADDYDNDDEEEGDDEKKFDGIGVLLEKNDHDDDDDAATVQTTAASSSRRALEIFKKLQEPSEELTAKNDEVSLPSSSTATGNSLSSTDGGKSLSTGDGLQQFGGAAAAADEDLSSIATTQSLTPEEQQERLKQVNFQVLCKDLGLNLNKRHVSTAECVLCQQPTVEPQQEQEKKPPLRRTKSRKNAPPCLLCGTPVCSVHSCPEFRKAIPHNSGPAMIVCVTCRNAFPKKSNETEDDEAVQQQQQGRSTTTKNHATLVKLLLGLDDEEEQSAQLNVARLQRLLETYQRVFSLLQRLKMYMEEFVCVPLLLQSTAIAQKLNGLLLNNGEKQKQQQRRLKKRLSFARATSTGTVAVAHSLAGRILILQQFAQAVVACIDLLQYIVLQKVKVRHGHDNISISTTAQLIQLLPKRKPSHSLHYLKVNLLLQIRQELLQQGGGGLPKHKELSKLKNRIVTHYEEHATDFKTTLTPNAVDALILDYQFQHQRKAARAESFESCSSIMTLDLSSTHHSGRSNSQFLDQETGAYPAPSIPESPPLISESAIDRQQSLPSLPPPPPPDEDESEEEEEKEPQSPLQKLPGLQSLQALLLLQQQQQATTDDDDDEDDDDEEEEDSQAGPGFHFFQSLPNANEVAGRFHPAGSSMNRQPSLLSLDDLVNADDPLELMEDQSCSSMYDSILESSTRNSNMLPSNTASSLLLS